MIWPFRRKPKLEARASGSGFTAEVISAREAYISGSRGLGELTATAQACISLWEGGFALADIDGTTLLTPSTLSMIGRSLALRGEAVMLITERGLVAAADWDLRTRDGIPTAYRLSVSEAGGGRSVTALAGEVLHPRIAMDPAAPWHGQAPLRRASLTAGLLQALESALGEVYDLAPLGSQIVPFPEAPDTDMDRLGRGFRGQRGRVLLRESVSTTAAGGPVPNADWRPSDVSPDLSRSMTGESLAAARDGIAAAFGVLPAMFNHSTTGPLIREAQRHLAQWTLQPVARVLAEEVSAKLGTQTSIDTLRPMQAFDAGGRARAVTGIVQALAAAEAANIDPNVALKLVDWD